MKDHLDQEENKVLRVREVILDQRDSAAVLALMAGMEREENKVSLVHRELRAQPAQMDEMGNQDLVENRDLGVKMEAQENLVRTEKEVKQDPKDQQADRVPVEKLDQTDPQERGETREHLVLRVKEDLMVELVKEESKGQQDNKAHQVPEVILDQLGPMAAEENLALLVNKENQEKPVPKETEERQGRLDLQVSGDQLDQKVQEAQMAQMDLLDHVVKKEQLAGLARPVILESKGNGEK